MEKRVSKLSALEEMLRGYRDVAVAYSGGVDSATLADVAHSVLGDGSVAVTALSPSLAPSELDAARALARERGWRHREVQTHELERAGYRENAPDRCYHCKTELFDVLATLFPGTTILSGTNADDHADFRPGERAAREHDVRAPLRDAGLTKEDVRGLARERGLSVWDKPASACLASRIAYGVTVTPERLDRVARAEAFLRDLGIRELRVRDHGDLARIEVSPDAIEILTRGGNRDRVARELRRLGFTYVTIDLEGFRSGSMNLQIMRSRAEA